jgi:hypothetical protein
MNQMGAKRRLIWKLEEGIRKGMGFALILT